MKEVSKLVSQSIENEILNSALNFTVQLECHYKFCIVPNEL